MYLQVTTKCNMGCAHCCYSCGPWGKHADIVTVRQAIRFAGLHESEAIAIGGGEPTLHPHFWEIVGLCLGNFDSVWLATNGTQTETTLRLAQLARQGALGVALSYDNWHDESMVHSSVVAAFRRDPSGPFNSNTDCREVRSIKNPIPQGRAQGWEWHKTDRRPCVCPEIFIKTSGIVKYCGCQHAPTIGNIQDGFIDPDFMSKLADRGTRCYRKSRE